MARIATDDKSGVCVTNAAVGATGPAVSTRSGQTGIDRLVNSLWSPVDAASLVLFRIGFGLIVAWWCFDELRTGRVRELYVEPRFHFTYYPFDFVRPWPGAGMYLHFVVLFMSALFIAAGFFYRAASLVFALGFTYFFLLERTNYQNHYYLLLLLSWLLPVLPAHRFLSLDAVQHPEIRSETAPAWALGLVRFHIGLPYVFGGIAKIESDWLAGEPMRQILAVHAAWPIVGTWFREEWCVMVFVWGGLLLDLSVVPLLLWRPTRIPAYAVCVLFHVTNAFLFQIHIFPWFMIFASTIFFDPGWPRRLLRLPRLTRPTVSRVSWSSLSRGTRCGAVLVGAYCLFHVVWPLRHHLYPGNASWTERGHLFSWRMMLRVKSAGVRYYVTDSGSGATGHPNLRGIINLDQAEKFGRDPEMVLDLAHFLARDFRQKTGRDAQVRALVLTSLNGRKPELTIDPSVDLAREPRGFHLRTWILPLTEPLREKPWSVPLLEWERHVELPQLSVMRQPVGAPRTESRSQLRHQSAARPAPTQPTNGR